MHFLTCKFEVSLLDSKAQGHLGPIKQDPESVYKAVPSARTLRRSHGRELEATARAERAEAATRAARQQLEFEKRLAAVETPAGVPLGRSVESPLPQHTDTGNPNHLKAPPTSPIAIL